MTRRAALAKEVAQLKDEALAIKDKKIGLEICQIEMSFFMLCICLIKFYLLFPGAALLLCLLAQGALEFLYLKIC